jgi:hypothetical protein
MRDNHVNACGRRWHEQHEKDVADEQARRKAAADNG